MALLKVWRTIRQRGIKAALKKAMTLAPAYASGIGEWRVRKCHCCQYPSIFLAQRNGVGETTSCLICSANERYELLAQELRSRYSSHLSKLDVLELDPHSPLQRILSAGHSYVRSFYEEGCTASRNGAVCEDITALSFRDGAFDLIVSSEVLEHVPELQKAFDETLRVLRPGGAHLFTVPPRASTIRRAEIVNGTILHMQPPDYHMDPLNPQGILAFWDIGPDLPQAVSCPGLRIRIVRGPVGDAGRVVWIAERTA